MKIIWKEGKLGIILMVIGLLIFFKISVSFLAIVLILLGAIDIITVIDENKDEINKKSKKDDDENY